MKLDENGDLLWNRKYRHANGPVGNNYLYDVIQTPDGGWAAVGYRNELDSIGTDVWVIKADSFGCLEPGCQLIDGLESIVDGLQNSMKVFPNPVQDVLNIEWSEEASPSRASGHAQRMIIIDALGRTVFEKSIPGISDTEALEVSALKTGLYTLHWLSGNSWLDSVKIIKE